MSAVPLFEQPLIIRKIFDSLPPYDVFKFRLVSRIWYDEAIRWLEKYPPIDECTIIVRMTPAHDEISTETGKSETIKANRALKKLPDSELKFKDDHFRWYLKEGESYQKVSKAIGDQVAMNFFDKKGDSIPSFCFLHSNISSKILTDQIPLNYPVLWVADQVLDDYPIIPCGDMNELASDENQNEIFTRLFTYIDSFLINSYTSEHKIMISNYGDPSSPKPNPYDLENPIKSMFFLISSPETESLPLITRRANSHMETMKTFVKHFEDIHVSGGVVNPRHRIAFINSCENDIFNESPAICISFIGEHVKSSAFMYNHNIDMKTFVDDPHEFKSNLDFPTTDFGVFGFIFEENLHGRTWKCRKEYHEKISATFPCVKFVKIMLKVAGYRLSDKCPDTTVVHLIRM